MSTIWVLVITILIEGDPMVTVGGRPAPAEVRIGNLYHHACEEGVEFLSAAVMDKADFEVLVLSAECIEQRGG